MGIFDRKANRIWDDLDKDYGERVERLPDTDASGQVIDKPRIMRNVRIVLSYAREMGDLGNSIEEAGPMAKTLTRLIKFCDYQVWLKVDPKDFAPIMLSLAEDALMITSTMEARGYITAATAVGDTTQIWLGILSSTGRHDEFMIALQLHAETQHNTLEGY